MPTFARLSSQRRFIGVENWISIDLKQVKIRAGLIKEERRQRKAGASDRGSRISARCCGRDGRVSSGSYGVRSDNDLDETEQ